MEFAVRGSTKKRLFDEFRGEGSLYEKASLRRTGPNATASPYRVASVIFLACQQGKIELVPVQTTGMQDETEQRRADEQLMERTANGDQMAFSALYDRLSGPLYSLAFKMLGDATEAEDALQDVCLQIWRRSAKYDASKSSVFSWAVLLTRGKVIDRLRARGRRTRVVAASTDDDDHPIGETAASTAESAADTANRNEEAVRVRSVLGSLPPEQRQAVEMAFFSDLTHHEIAARLNQPLGTIKARIRRGLLKVRDGLGGKS